MATKQTKEDVLIPQSAIPDKVSRTAYAALSPRDQLKYLSDQFGTERIVQLDSGKLGVRRSDDPTAIYPVDVEIGEGGAEEFLGDISEILPYVPKAGAQVVGGTLGGAAGALTTPVTGFVGPIAGTVLGAATGAGLTDVALQKIAQKKLGVEAPADLSQSAQEALLAGITAPGTGTLLKGGLRTALGKQTFKEALETASAKALGKGALTETIAPKIAKTTKQTITGAKLIADGLQDSTVMDIATNPYVNKKVGIGIVENLENYAKEAADDIIDLKKNFKNLRHNAYLKAGVKDTDLIDVNKTINELKNYIKTESVEAISKEDKEIVDIAKNYLGRLKKEAPNGFLKYKNAKQITDRLADKINSEITDIGTKTMKGKSYSFIQKLMTEAKNSHPKIAPAADKFKRLLDLEDRLEEIVRLDRFGGENTLEKKLLTRYQDQGNQVFKQKLNEINDIIKSTPELNKYKNLINKVKIVHAGKDIQSTKALPRTGWLGTVPGIGKLLKETTLGTEEKANILAQLSRGKKIDVSKLSKQYEIPQIPVIGKPIARLKAKAELYKSPLGPLNLLTEKIPGQKWAIPQAMKETIKYPIRNLQYKDQINSLLNYINQKNYNSPKVEPTGEMNSDYVAYTRAIRQMATKARF